VGRWQVAQAQTTCVDCASGRWINHTGATACVRCGPGTFQPLSGQSTCPTCPSGSVAIESGVSCECAAGFASFPTLLVVLPSGSDSSSAPPTPVQPLLCRICPRGANCSMPNTAWHALEAATGFAWTLNSHGEVTFIPCAACTGAGECLQGYSGATCHVCASDYALDLLGTCSRCPAGSVVLAEGAGLAVLLATVVLCLSVLHSYRVDHQQRAQVQLAPTRRFHYLRKRTAALAKILVAALHLLWLALSVLVSATQHAPVQRTFREGVLRFTSLPQAFACLGQQQRLLWASWLLALVPLTAGAASLCFLSRFALCRPYTALGQRFDLLEQRAQLRLTAALEGGIGAVAAADLRSPALYKAHLREQFTTVLLVLFFILQPAAVRQTVALLDNIGRGAQSEWWAFTLAILGLVLFFIVPLLGLSVYLQRDDLSDFLFSGLRSRGRWWELVSMTRRVLLVTCVTVLLQHSAETLCFLCALLTGGSALLVSGCSPYVSRLLNRVEVTALAGATLLFWLAQWSLVRPSDPALPFLLLTALVAVGLYIITLLGLCCHQYWLTRKAHRVALLQAQQPLDEEIPSQQQQQQQQQQPHRQYTPNLPLSAPPASPSSYESSRVSEPGAFGVSFTLSPHSQFRSGPVQSPVMTPGLHSPSLFRLVSPATQSKSD
jgi:hypothetical protein